MRFVRSRSSERPGSSRFGGEWAADLPSGEPPPARALLLRGWFAWAFYALELATILGVAVAALEVSFVYSTASGVRLGKFVAFLVVALAAASLLRTERHSDRRALGLRSCRATHAVAALGLGVGLAGLQLALAYSFPEATAPSGPENPVQFSGLLPVHRALAIAQVTLLAPVVEEFTYRGYLLSAFRLAWGTGLASALTIALFPSAHWPAISHPVPAAALGALAPRTTSARLYSESLVPAVAIHVGFNTAIMALVLMS